MAESATEIDLDSVIDRLLEGELAQPSSPAWSYRLALAPSIRWERRTGTLAERCVGNTEHVAETVGCDHAVDALY